MDHQIFQVIRQHQNEQPNEHFVRDCREAFRHITIEENGNETVTDYHRDIINRVNDYYTMPFNMQLGRIVIYNSTKLYELTSVSTKNMNLIVVRRPMSIPPHYPLLPYFSDFPFCQSEDTVAHAYLYGDFKLLSWHIDDWVKREQLYVVRGLIPWLKTIIRGYVNTVIRFHCDGRCHGDITEHSLVVFKEEGKLLANQHASSNVNTADDLNALGDALEKVWCDYDWGEADREEVDCLPRGLKEFINFMKNITTGEECAWLKYSPFISTHREILERIPRFHAIVMTIPQFKKSLTQKTLSWLVGKANEFGKVELSEMFANANSSNFFEFQKRLRHCCAHIHEHVVVTEDLDSDEVQELQPSGQHTVDVTEDPVSDKVKELRPSGEQRNDFSTLMLQPEEMMLFSSSLWIRTSWTLYFMRQHLFFG